MFTLKAPQTSDFKDILYIKGGKYNGQTISIDTDFSRDANNEGKFKEIVIHDGTLEIMPPANNKRQCIFIIGPSGSGKSYFCSQYLTRYKNIYPNNDIVLISPVTDDKILNRHNPIKLSINDSNFLDPESRVELEELRDKLVIFDDISALKDKKLREGVQQLVQEVLLTGRHYNISCLITEHLLILSNTYIKHCINESHALVLFPKSGSKYHTKRILKEYAGFGPKDINKVLSIPSRSVFIHKNFPPYIVGKDCAFMIE
jgi:predicted AAA+ superfamily ATPase